ncbi:MAG: hypothetical protein QFB86_01040 [Patescibacteria group bacterium]|nr:hypothetical protein [Patescibacteria group bacterium]
MAEKRIYDDEQNFIGVIPVVEYDTSLGVLAFDYTNTLRKVYSIECAAANHIEHKTEDGRLIGLLFSATDTEILDELDKLNFPLSVTAGPTPPDAEYFDKTFLSTIGGTGIASPHEYLYEIAGAKNNVPKQIETLLGSFAILAGNYLLDLFTDKPK